MRKTNHYDCRPGDYNLKYRGQNMTTGIDSEEQQFVCRDGKSSHFSVFRIVSITMIAFTAAFSVTALSVVYRMQSPEPAGSYFSVTESVAKT
ncbi:hypothetical protein BaRGS_00034437 [Batillaria attramentaria]|uniref:Uncharacterized protein n=1 Tax=Batillaria attramentaria TaxID=370345 RepID=A0ABD0JIR1_9CAEN